MTSGDVAARFLFPWSWLSLANLSGIRLLWLLLGGSQWLLSIGGFSLGLF
jgi:hypothetical protein